MNIPQHDAKNEDLYESYSEIPSAACSNSSFKESLPFTALSRVVNLTERSLGRGGHFHHFSLKTDTKTSSVHTVTVLLR